eukprot:TRINITY_DN11546_c5_g1_i1.p1 TRINITY_DN11546_c5_g1~~TRINITY_DN11546_c5_g1_i1.p1  ORF type:complete len:643 (+),score=243.16 TRINITY_DN11546_c5_g1_i1:89-1930(+)
MPQAGAAAAAGPVPAGDPMPLRMQPEPGGAAAPMEWHFDADCDDEEGLHQLPSLVHCTGGKMEEVMLVTPAEASSSMSGHVPQNGLAPDPGVAWACAADDRAPWWCAPLPAGTTEPVALVVVHAAVHDKCGLPPERTVLTEVQVEVLTAMPSAKVPEAGIAAWTSAIQSVAPSDQPADAEKLFFFVPSVRGRGIRVKRARSGGARAGEPLALALRTVQCFVMPATKYKLSKTILTIDKYAVAQPFSLSELAHSTAYANLYTSSAVHELGHQESFVEEREQEALNLTHHLAGIWDPQGMCFKHGQHLQTVQLVMMNVMENAKQIFLSEPKLVDMKAPCYVFGDIHGNFEDLLYFTSNLIPFKHIKYASHGFVFLGDYVDRGPHDVECLAYLLSLKVQAPRKVVLLRGNHEDRRQNARLEESFYNHCVALFGKEAGTQVWQKANEVFELMPLCSVIDNRIFCCHGGVPRVPRDATGQPMRIRQVIEQIPMPLVQVGDSDNPYLQTATDLLWGDPTQDSGKGGGKEQYFEKNEARGCSCCFGQKAVSDFLELNSLEYFMRAHQFFSFGVNISKGGKVITLFSSSNYCDHNSCAGCALVATDDRVQLLMKEHQAPQS